MCWNGESGQVHAAATFFSVDRCSVRIVQEAEWAAESASSCWGEENVLCVRIQNIIGNMKNLPSSKHSVMIL